MLQEHIPQEIHQQQPTQEQPLLDHGHHSSHDDRDHSHSHSLSHSHSHSHSSSPYFSPSTPSFKLSAPVPVSPPHITLNQQLLIDVFSFPQTAALAVYTACKLLYTLCLIIVGLAAADTTIISSSFHVFFDCVAMVCSLYAILVTREGSNASRSFHHISSNRLPPPTASSFMYSYGYARFEMVAAFTNAIFLFFVSTFLFIELFHSITQHTSTAQDNQSGNTEEDPQTDKLRHLLVISGLAVDVVGLWSFHRWSNLSSLLRTATADNTAHICNMHSIYLFALSDTIQHTLFLAAAYLPTLLPFSASLLSSLFLSSSHLHSLSFFVTSLVLVYITLPLFRLSAKVLAQTCDDSHKLTLERAMREISFYDGILECRSAHFWSIAPSPQTSTQSIAGTSTPASASSSATCNNTLVGSVHIRVRADANEQTILNDVSNVLKKYVSELTVQIEKDSSASSWLAGSME